MKASESSCFSPVSVYLSFPRSAAVPGAGIKKLTWQQGVGTSVCLHTFVKVLVYDTSRMEALIYFLQQYNFVAK